MPDSPKAGTALTVTTDKPAYRPGEPVTVTVAGVAPSATVTVTATAGNQAGTASYVIGDVPVEVSDDHGGTWAAQPDGTFTSTALSAPGLAGAEPSAASLQTAGIKALSWCGYTWEVEDWGTAPGQPKASQVKISPDGSLVLTAGQAGILFAGAEVDSARGDGALTGNTSRWGYGTYRWVIGTDPSTVSPGLVLGLFTYQSSAKGGPAGHKEIDIELCAPTGNTEIFQLGFYADTEAGISSAVPPLHVLTSGSQVPVRPAPLVTAEFTWLPESVAWSVWYGADTSAKPDIAHTVSQGEAYEYTEVYGGNVFAGTASVPPAGSHQVVMNLWSVNGAVLSAASSVEIKSFSFTPA